ncbi:MAG: hypothetical protein EBS54_00775 [Betaproteobacteria bacterium]|nr:hypothetical protein [Betaproteobacteria bacterium]
MVSFCLSRVIVATQHWHGRWSLDAVDGVQKSHALPTPRIGGLAIAAAMVLAWGILEFGPQQWLDSAAQGTLADLLGRSACGPRWSQGFCSAF